MDEYISSLQKENNQLKLKHDNLKQTILKKDNYISQLEEKIVQLEEKYFQNQDNEKKKYELFDTIKKTQENINVLRDLFTQKFSQLQNKYIKLREKVEKQNNKNNSIENINKYISKINKVKFLFLNYIVYS
jgi:chromosome segregation ATPase